MPSFLDHRPIRVHAALARSAAALLLLVVVACSSSEEDVVVAWEEYHRAASALDVGAVRSMLTTEREEELAGPDAAAALGLRVSLVPAAPVVTRVEVHSTDATVQLSGLVGSGDITGTVAFRLEGGAWKVSKEDWDFQLAMPGAAAAPVPPVRLAETYAAGPSSPPQIRAGFAAHGGSVTALAYTRDGRCLVSIGYDDSRLCLWDAATGSRLDVIGLDDRPADLALAPDGSVVYVVDTAGRITEWPIHRDLFGDPRPLAGLAGPTPRIAVDAAGRAAVTTSWEDPAKLWDLEARSFVRSLPRSERMRGVAFSPVGPVVVCGSRGDSFVEWNLDRLSWPVGGRKERRVPKVSADSDVWSVAFSPDGRRLATGHMDSSISIWDAERGKQIHNWYVQDCSIRDVEFSPCGTVLATAQQDGRVHLWDVETRRTLARLQSHEGAALAVAFHPADGVTIATGGEDGAVRVWR